MLPPVFEKLNASQALKSQLGNTLRVFYAVAPEPTPSPYVVWQTIGGEALEHLDTSANVDDVQLQVMVWDTDPKRGDQIRDAVRVLLESHCNIGNSHLSNYDPDTKLHGFGFDAAWLLHRDSV